MTIITTGIPNVPMACQLDIHTFVKDTDVFNVRYPMTMDLSTKLQPDHWVTTPACCVTARTTSPK